MTFHIKQGNEDLHPTVKINGTNISHLVTGVSINSNVGEMTTADVSLIPSSMCIEIPDDAVRLIQKSDANNDHCCRQFSDLSGLTVEEVERVGSCGCMQAKRLLERMAEALREFAAFEVPDSTQLTACPKMQAVLELLAEFDAMKRGENK